MKKNLLEAKMKIHGDIQSDLAEYLGITLQTFNRKLNKKGGSRFDEDEIRMIAERYNLTSEEVVEIFLT